MAEYEAPKVEVVGSVAELTLHDGSKTATTVKPLG